MIEPSNEKANISGATGIDNQGGCQLQQPDSPSLCGLKR